MSELILVVALLIALGSWIGLGVILYKEHLEERERVTEEWRKRNERSELNKRRNSKTEKEKRVSRVAHRC